MRSDFYGLLFEIEHVTRTYHEKIRFLRCMHAVFSVAIADSNRKTGMANCWGEKRAITPSCSAVRCTSTSFLS